MPKVKRFFYVRSPTSSVIHVSSAPHFVEGELTWCGRRFAKGWLYFIGSRLRAVGKDRSMCAQCWAQRK